MYHPGTMWLGILYRECVCVSVVLAYISCRMVVGGLWFVWLDWCGVCACMSVQHMCVSWSVMGVCAILCGVVRVRERDVCIVVMCEYLGCV